MTEKNCRNFLAASGCDPDFIESAIKNRKAELCLAMRTRVLTQEEHDEAISYGEDLLIFEIHDQINVRKETRFRLFNEMWLQQYRLRALQTSPNH